MSGPGGKGMLVMAHRQLQVRWEETRGTWRDAQSRRFEEDYLTEIADALGGTIRAIDELGRLLEKIHADCE